MKVPICDICMNSGILCPVCNDKVNSGVVRKEDIESLKKIQDVARHIEPLKDIEVLRVIETPDLMVLFCARGQLKYVVGKGGTIIRNLTKAMGKKVRVVEQTDDPKEFLEMLVFPVEIISVGKVYKPKGSEDGSGEAVRVRVPEGEKLPVSVERINDIFTEVFGHEVEVISE